MRKLTDIEKERLKLLTKRSISFALIEPTSTGLEKSIMDATSPVRDYLKSEGVHDYELQGQGGEHKVLLRGCFIKSNKKIKKKVSLYRPISKEGDPRIWIYGLHNLVNPNNIICLIYYSDILYAFNLSRLPVEDLLIEGTANPFKEIIEDINTEENAVANELLLKLKDIASQGFIPSQVAADTSVGRTLERLLDIQMNSSAEPDYKGIELKSYRNKGGSRKNLFAKVPNWDLSKFKSSEEILSTFGYMSDGKFRFNTTVYASHRNPQGILLRINDTKGWLVENSDKDDIGNFAVWKFSTLHESLTSKHSETFWIRAKTKSINGIEHFRYTDVEHTKDPIVPQFQVLIENGIITLDHLIYRTSKGGARERGPLFKIRPNSLDLLFPPSQKYDLLD